MRPGSRGSRGALSPTGPDTDTIASGEGAVAGAGAVGSGLGSPGEDTGSSSALGSVLGVKDERDTRRPSVFVDFEHSYQGLTDDVQAYTRDGQPEREEQEREQEREQQEQEQQQEEEEEGVEKEAEVQTGAERGGETAPDIGATETADTVSDGESLPGTSKGTIPKGTIQGNIPKGIQGSIAGNVLNCVNMTMQCLVENFPSSNLSGLGGFKGRGVEDGSIGRGSRGSRGSGSWGSEVSEGNTSTAAPAPNATGGVQEDMRGSSAVMGKERLLERTHNNVLDVRITIIANTNGQRRVYGPSLVPREIFQQMARETFRQGTEAVDFQGTEATTTPELAPWMPWLRRLAGEKWTLGTRLPPSSYFPPSRNPMWFRMS
mmetsp:Transcript_20489/g.45598  ORF Transcript_20489/g.45598 Transcript_20489/m.45598 type:complete len:375 (+) Transcript_20489:1-1125(+)